MRTLPAQVERKLFSAGVRHEGVAEIDVKEGGRGFADGCNETEASDGEGACRSLKERLGSNEVGVFVYCACWCYLGERSFVLYFFSACVFTLPLSIYIGLCLILRRHLFFISKAVS